MLVARDKQPTTIQEVAKFIGVGNSVRLHSFIITTHYHLAVDQYFGLYESPVKGRMMMMMIRALILERKINYQDTKKKRHQEF